MTFSFDPIFAVDGSDPENVACDAIITIFAPADTTMTPLTITAPDGSPLANPIRVNDKGLASAFTHASLSRVAWEGGGFSGSFLAVAETAAPEAYDSAADKQSPTESRISSASARAEMLPSAVASEPGGGDDTASLNALLAANAGKGVQLRAGRTYRISDALSVPSGSTFDLNGATLDARAVPVATALGQRKAISISGSLGPATAITTAIPQWSRLITGITSTAELVAGDLVLISNDERPIPGLTRADRDKGQLALVRSVDSESQITLVQGLYLAYGTTSLTVRKVVPARNVTVRNGTVLMGGAGTAHNGVFVQLGRDITAENLHIVGAEDSGISYLTVWNGRIRGNDISGSTSSEKLGTTGYGVAVTEGSAHVTVTGNDFENCRHWVAGGGQWPTTFVEVTDNRGTNSVAAGFECHESTYYWKLAGNTATGCDTGFLIRGQYVTVEGNEVNESSAFSILVTTYDLVSEQRGIRIINNRDHRSAFGIKVDGQTGLDQPDSVKINLEVRGNEVKDSEGAGILVRHFDGANVIGNTVDGTAQEGIRLIGLPASRSKNLKMGLNAVCNTTMVGIKAENVDGIQSNGDSVLNAGNYGVELQDCTRTGWANIEVHAPNLSGMLIAGGAVHNVTTPMISGITTAAYDAVRVTGSADLTVTGGYLASPRHAVYATTTGNVTVTGINAKNAIHETKINVDATDQMVASNLI